jgi:hypothetical protein
MENKITEIGITSFTYGKRLAHYYSIYEIEEGLIHLNSVMGCHETKLFKNPSNDLLLMMKYNVTISGVIIDVEGTQGHHNLCNTLKVPIINIPIFPMVLDNMAKVYGLPIPSHNPKAETILIHTLIKDHIKGHLPEYSVGRCYDCVEEWGRDDRPTLG